MHTRPLRIALVLIVALFAPSAPAGAQGRGDDIDRSLALFEQVYRFVERNYVDEIDPDVLIEGALQGLFESLDDPHSAYLDVGEMVRMNDTTAGEFGGVGMYISKPSEEDAGDDPAYVEIVSPIEDTPAFRAGLRAGDLIKEVDGESTSEQTIDTVVDRLRGAPGTTVNITILRGASLEFPVTLERAIIEIPTVKHAMIGDDVAFLRITSFTPFTEDRVRDALAEFEDADYSGLIIDLRSNPGGVLNGVVDVADHFFDDGLIVETRSRNASERQRFVARRGVLVDDAIPIVVLIDGGSASAAEILAGALGDRERAILVGETTYGKGSVQQVRSLGEAGFRLTMSRYYTPSGQTIDRVGIEPDIEVAEPELTEEEEQSYARIREERRVEQFVERTVDPSAAEIDAFVIDLRADGIVLNERWIRRLVRVEANRVNNRSDVYDLDYDLVLQRAVTILEDEMGRRVR